MLIDFSKAFDIVDHGILASRLTGLNIPSSILQCIFTLSFLTDRTQYVKQIKAHLHLLLTFCHGLYKPLAKDKVMGMDRFQF